MALQYTQETFNCIRDHIFTTMSTWVYQIRHNILMVYYEMSISFSLIFLIAIYIQQNILISCLKLIFKKHFKNV